jgi:hypothetical protein
MSICNLALGTIKPRALMDRGMEREVKQQAVAIITGLPTAEMWCIADVRETNSSATMIYCVGIVSIYAVRRQGLVLRQFPACSCRLRPRCRSTSELYFFEPITASFAALATRNLMTVFAGI